MNRDEKRDTPGFFFEEMEHTADVALRVRGKDLRELMENAAKAMASVIGGPNARVDEILEIRVDLEADDPEGLLVEWLSELLFIAETRSAVFESADFPEVAPTVLKACVRAAIVSDLKAHVKAATYHNLEIVETGSGLEATVVLDI